MSPLAEENEPSGGRRWRLLCGVVSCSDSQDCFTIFVWSYVGFDWEGFEQTLTK